MIRYSHILLSFAFILFWAATGLGQYSFNYQGLARNGDGEPLMLQEIAVQISIHQGSESGEVIYRERHYPITSDRGLFGVQVGMGIHEFGTFETISWGDDDYYIRTRIDPDGGTAYTDLGASPLYAVPYAMHAQSADNALNDSDNQQLTLSGDILSIGSGNSVDLSNIKDGVMDADSDPNNEIQSLTISGNVLGLSNSNSVSLPSFMDNDNQQLQFSGNNLSIEGGNTIDLTPLVNDADADPTNELQSLVLSNNVLGISGSNSVSLPTDTDDQYLSISGTDLSIEGGNTINLSGLVNDADADPSNELQTLAIYGNSLGISGGNMVTLPYVLNNSPWETTTKGIQYEGGEYARVFNINGSISLSPYQGWLHESPDGYTISRIDNVSNTGSISLFSYDSRTVDIWSDFNGAGKVTTYLDNDRMAELDHYAKGGRFSLFFNDVVKVESNTFEDVGFLATYGRTTDKRNIELSWLKDFKDHGYLGILESGEYVRVEAYPCRHRSGIIGTYGLNGLENISITHLFDYPNNGYMAVMDRFGNERAGIYIDQSGFGSVFADSYVSFIPNHEKSGEKVMYAMLQGPESASYVRGTAILKNGVGEVNLPSHFSDHVSEDGITVMITPLSAESKGIAVVKKGKNGFRVKELMEGSGNYEFDWEVKGVRNIDGYEKSINSSDLPKGAHSSDGISNNSNSGRS